MKFIHMNSEHVQQVAALEVICFSTPWSEKSILQETVNPLSCWIVAVEEDRVVGYIGSQAVLGEADMMNIAVDPGFRRRGIAEKLVQMLISELKSKSVHSITLEVRVSNTPAQELYTKLGFSQIGRRPGYYSHPKEDALILKKEWENENSGN